MIFDWQQDYHRYQRYFVDLRGLYKHKKVIVYTGLTLTVLAVSFFSFFALKPTITTILSLVRETKEKRDIDQKLQTKINAIRVAETNLSAAGNAIKLLDDSLPAEPRLSQIIYHLEFLAQEENLTILSLGFEPVAILGTNKDARNRVKKGVNEPTEVNFSLTAVGNFENLSRFLDKIENLRRIVMIDTFNLNSNQTEMGQLINFSLNGRFFYWLEEDIK